jgi:hypothetical protein
MSKHQPDTAKPSHDVIQTLRTAHQNQTQLNLMADQKANILIGTLVLVFTVVITRFLSLAETAGHALMPLLVFMIMELIPLVLTVMVLIPKNVTDRPVKDISELKNPLFFGMFTQFSEAEYQHYLNRILTDNEAARNLLIRDIYQLGQVLRRKYRLLRLAYLFAMLGVLVPALLAVLQYAI